MLTFVRDSRIDMLAQLVETEIFTLEESKACAMRLLELTPADTQSEPSENNEPEIRTVKPMTAEEFRSFYGGNYSIMNCSSPVSTVTGISEPSKPEQGMLPFPELENPLSTDREQLLDLLRELGCQGHQGAVKEIRNLRRIAGIDKTDTEPTVEVKESEPDTTEPYSPKYIRTRSLLKELRADFPLLTRKELHRALSATGLIEFPSEKGAGAITDIGKKYGTQHKYAGVFWIEQRIVPLMKQVLKFWNTNNNGA